MLHRLMRTERASLRGTAVSSRIFELPPTYISAGTRHASMKYPLASCEHAVILDKWTGSEGAAYQAFHTMHSFHTQALQNNVDYLLQQCADNQNLKAARELHYVIAANGVGLVVELADPLLHVFASYENLLEVSLVFCCLENPSVSSWHTIIAAHVKCNECGKAVNIYHEFLGTGKEPTRSIYLCILKACGRMGAIGLDQSVHAQIVESDVKIDVFIGSSLIDMYAKCGGLDEAIKVFYSLTDQNVVTWVAMIEGYAKHGHDIVAFKLFEEMLKRGLKPDKVTYVCLLKVCISREALDKGQLIHNDIMLSGDDSNVVVSCALVDMYVKCGSLEEARKVFDMSVNRNVVLWGAMIAGYVLHSNGKSALELFKQLEKEGPVSNKCILSSALNACKSLGDLSQGQLLHDHVIRSSFELDVVVGSTLIDMYAHNGRLEEAHRVFLRLQDRNVICWGALLTGYATHGYSLPAFELFGKMEQEGVMINENILSCMLKVCTTAVALGYGRMVHDLAIRNEFETEGYVSSAILDMYAKCGSWKEACNVFKYMQCCNAMSWGVMISGFVEHDDFSLALEYFKKMQENLIQPTKSVYMCTLKACGSTEALEQGRLVHSEIIKIQLDLDLEVGTSLIDMYAKCSSLPEAVKVFHMLSSQDVVSWCALIEAYVHNDCGYLALLVYKDMQEQGIMPDKLLFLCILKACGAVRALEHGELIHSHVVESGLEADVGLGNVLIEMYSKCGSLKPAEKVFSELASCDAVSWSVLIAGYCQHGEGLHALEACERMLQDGCEPDQCIFITVLTACSCTGASRPGKCIHNEVIQHGLETSLTVGNALINMYAKCGAMEDAHKVFSGLKCKDALSWGAMIAGFACNDDGLSAIRLFENMQDDGIKPNKVLFLCILHACSTVGALDKGKLIHKEIVNNGIDNDVSIGNTIVDMYAKCGNLEEAHAVFSRLTNRDVVSWVAMIAGYAQHGHCRLALNCLDDMQMQGLKPHDSIYTTVLSACSDAGLLEEGCLCFQTMIDHGVKPNIEHHICMADLLSSSGRLLEAQQLLENMPIPHSSVGWTSLLSACKRYGNLELGRCCFSQVLQLESNLAAGFVLMSNIYADANMWDEVCQTQELRKSKGARKKPGKVWMEVHNVVYEFVVGERFHPQRDVLYDFVKRLNVLAGGRGYVPHIDVISDLPLNEDNFDVPLASQLS